MGKHLSPLDVQRVVELLAFSGGRVTWDVVCETCEEKLGITAVRQTLANSRAIRDAFKAAKQRIAQEKTLDVSPGSLRAASERIERLEKKVSQLTEVNLLLTERFVRWQYNAYMRGLSEKDLESPLPVAGRGE